ncbi:LytR/AlgR family response regulator transcription factor [Flavobacterium sp. KACC 22763]|uniref:LytR/AlgR family response regulator transcription factor n=1 Tax=Flavobacterium sp. KACC 22763 TaxID=3025668 RepID=UPI002366AEDD|nr:LytTR family DNA-binding domain-containing protein [Flavobacterium sp. KACC 22763]WDF63309.1 LytTR family transcriptional regulator DNA-binding domain-containing protein [Flavobacterium sp. KACC 22763]
MKKYSYIIIDDDAESILKTQTAASGFSELSFTASASNFQEGLELVLEHKPDLIFLEIESKNPSSHLSLTFISELHRFFQEIPKIIITTNTKEKAFDAIQYGVFDYLLKPIAHIYLLKTVLKLKKANLAPKTANAIDEQTSIVIDNVNNVTIPQNIEKPLTICIKSYGDYRYLNAADICYFQADNNSTDIYLNTGEMITAFKTLKHFESVLTYPFIRIHNSYVINRNYISRIHSGNSICYIKNSTKKIPFSKTYRANVEQIIADFAAGNYLEV